MIAGYLTICEAAERSRLSVRTIRRALRDTRRPLGHSRVGRRVVIAERALVDWIEAHRATPAPSADLLQRVSPAARQLLTGMLGTPAAPGARKCANVQGRPADAVNAGGEN